MAARRRSDTSKTARNYRRHQKPPVLVARRREVLIERDFCRNSEQLCSGADSYSVPGSWRAAPSLVAGRGRPR